MVDSVPFSMNSCTHSAVFTSALLLFCHLVEKEKPVMRRAELSGPVVCVRRRSGSLLICPLGSRRRKITDRVGGQAGAVGVASPLHAAYHSPASLNKHCCCWPRTPVPCKESKLRGH